MIRSFADRKTERFWRTGRSRRLPPALWERAKQKLAMLDMAADLRDLAAVPGNRLELLHGDRTGQHSIRINDQFRICFHWERAEAFEVEITDYH